MIDLPRVPCPQGTLVIADLHLDVSDSQAVERFARWLLGLRAVPRLVILGDLFEFWVGPRQLRLAGARRATDALSELVRSGTTVDVLHGNRDFLLGRGFERASGAAVHPRGLLGQAGSATTLFVHGDELCTADRGYQRLRRVLRSGSVRWLLHRLPFALQLALATRLRAASSTALAAKARDRVSLVAEAAESLSAALGAHVLVCGHAHRARDERRGELRWLVLDAWGGVRDALRLEPDGWRACSSGVGPASGGPD